VFSYLMNNMQVQTPTLEENFVFGSPPLLNSFTYNTCRSQEGSAITSSTAQHQERFLAEDPLTSDSNMSYCHQKFPSNNTNNNNNSRQQYSGFPLKNGGSMLESLNQLYLNSNGGRSYQQHQQQTDNGRKILEQANFNKLQYHHQQQQHYHQQQQHQFNNNNNNNNNTNMKNELVFKKRKDLRVLKAVLSTERFRKVTMMFGDGDEGGREIVESVHKAMRSSNTGAVSCLFCNNYSQVYENFPIVDGTLFLSPVKLSKTCIRFDDQQQKSSNGLESSTTRHMCFICVSCLEGKPKKLECSSCIAPWNGSFFQVGTLYSYNILSAIPCCEWKVHCKNCTKPIIDWKNGDASTLFFSHFSTKAVCPHCNVDDYHYIKSLDTLRKSCF